MSDDARIDATVAGYRIQSLIGRGGMSIVYLAEHVQLGRQVALKLLAPSLSADPEFRERFAHESRRAAEVDHPNVVPIFDAGEAEGQLFIAMRYIEGCDLKNLIRREGRLGIERTLLILEQAADGLDAAHERNLIHRDVKPANILVAEPSGHVYLTDFGVVKHTATQGLTKTGFFLGTVGYAAPEQIEGLPVDARTDGYALGCVLYECLAGQAPFERDRELAVMHAHLVQPPPVLPTALPALPKGLDAVIAKAMAKSKDERYATCGDVVAAARQAALERKTSSISAGASAVTVPAAPEAGGVRGLPPTAIEADEPSLASMPPAAPPAPATPPAPAEPRPRTRPSRTGALARRRRRGPSLPIIVAIALLVAVTSGSVAYLATRASHSSHPGSTLAAHVRAASGIATSATTTGATSRKATGARRLDISQRRLRNSIPTLIRPSCGSVPQATDKLAGAVAAFACDYHDPSFGRILLRVDRLDNRLDVLAAYGHFGTRNAKLHGLQLNPRRPDRATTGGCNSTSWRGEGPWYRTNPNTSAHPNGRYVCYQLTQSRCDLATTTKPVIAEKTCSVIVWTDYSDKMVVTAEQPAREQARLAAFFSHWIHPRG
jgi:hypothetical protein